MSADTREEKAAPVLKADLAASPAGRGILMTAQIRKTRRKRWINYMRSMKI